MLGNPYDIASTLHNIGGVSADKGLYDQALTYLFKALDLRKQLGNSQEVAETAMNAGTVYESLGRLADAQKLYEQARTVLEKSGDKASLASCFVNLANIAAQQSRYDEALNLENQALGLRQKVASPQETAQCWTNLGSIYEMRGRRDDYDRALEFYNQALPGVEASHNPQALAMLLDDFGAVYQHKKDYERAISFHKRGLELRRTAGNLQQVVISLTNLGGAYQNLNRLDEAEACFKEAALAFEKIGEQVGEPSQYGAYQQTISSFYAHYANLKLVQKHPLDALVTVERGRARGVALQAGRNATALDSRLRPDDLAKKRGLEETLSRSSARLNQILRSFPSGDPEEEKARQNRLKTAQRDFDVAESEYQSWRDAFFARNPEYQRISGQSPPDVNALTALARRNSDTLYLEWQVVDDKGMLLFALSNAGLKSFVLAVHIGDLEKRVNTWLGAIDAGRFGEASKTVGPKEEAKESNALYRLLFGDIEAAGLFKSARFKRLVFVADGVLLRVPFAALMASDGKRLVDHYVLASAISLGSLTWPAEKLPTNESLLCIADPLGNGVQVVSRTRGEFGALAGARSEAKAIKALLPTTNLLLGAQAREARVKREMPNYAVLHFATHGALDTMNPMHSALILAPEPANGGEDGILDAREIAGMHLSARLAVLSACQTAGGQVRGGDGLIGLTWAFRAAGCPAIVATHWEINDTATTVLMRTFYGALAAGRRKDDALSAAMHAVMAGKTRRSPYYWAAFQIIGDTSPLNLRR